MQMLKKKAICLLKYLRLNIITSLSCLPLVSFNKMITLIVKIIDMYKPLLYNYSISADSDSA